MLTGSTWVHACSLRLSLCVRCGEEEGSDSCSFYGQADYRPYSQTWAACVGLPVRLGDPMARVLSHELGFTAFHCCAFSSPCVLVKVRHLNIRHWLMVQPWQHLLLHLLHLSLGTAERACSQTIRSQGRAATGEGGMYIKVKSVCVKGGGGV